jgi:peptidoglycan/xylan/chitin deacetylase (PgdA/CDA1 family)
MYVSPETLRMHLAVLRKHFEIVDLRDWVERTRTAQPLPVRACAITFDDGWRDNFEHAFPVLRDARVPATIFLVANAIGASYSFWPNRLARALRTLQSHEIWKQWSDAVRAAGAPAGIVDGAPPFDVDAIDRIIAALKSLSDVTNIELVGQLERSVSSAPIDAERDMVSRAEIAEMRASGLIRFGSHTCRHIRLLPFVNTEVLQQEVVQSRSALETLLGEAVDLFCYPNGDYCDHALDIVRSTYSAAVTTQDGWNGSGSDMHLLRRLGIHDDIAKTERHFLARLTGLV